MDSPARSFPPGLLTVGTAADADPTPNPSGRPPVAPRLLECRESPSGVILYRMAVLRENIPLLDQVVTLYAGHQTEDPVGRRWAQRRDTLEVLGLAFTQTRVQFLVRFDPARPYISGDRLTDQDGAIWQVEGAALLGRRQFVLLHCTRQGFGLQ